MSDIARAETVDELWRQPIQKPKTRGNYVAVVDAEVEGYYEVGLVKKLIQNYRAAAATLNRTRSLR